jgi:hypothetical protein
MRLQCSPVEGLTANRFPTTTALRYKMGSVFFFSKEKAQRGRFQSHCDAPIPGDQAPTYPQKTHKNDWKNVFGIVS